MQGALAQARRWLEETAPAAVPEPPAPPPPEPEPEPQIIRVTLDPPAPPPDLPPRAAPPHPEPEPAPTPAPKPLSELPGSFAGTGWQIYRLALFTGLFNILTLGLFRFWRRTYIRRWYWSSIRIDGIPLEYTGTPGEKILGFFVAVVLLAFYISVVNLALTFFSVTVLSDIAPAYMLSFLGVIPLWFYAQYRARRYIMARTRWRGIRFGQRAGAWGYALRAVLFWTLTLVSLGLLWPLMTHRLEVYRTNRTYFGDMPMVQHGRWWHLYAGYWPIPIVVALLVAARMGEFAPPALRAWVDQFLPTLTYDEAQAISTALVGGSLTLLLLLFGLYRITAFLRLTRTKSLGGAPLQFALRPWRVVWIYLWGGLKALVLTAFMLAMTAGLALVVASALMLPVEDILPLDLSGGGVALDPSRLNTTFLTQTPVQITLVVTYFLTFLFWSVSRETCITYPLIRAYAHALSLGDPQSLTRVQQRGKDEVAQAEGFADALDVGASL